MESMTTRVAGHFSRSRRAAPTPFMSGIEMSMTTTSGLSSTARCIAARQIFDLLLALRLQSLAFFDLALQLGGARGDLLLERGVERFQLGVQPPRGLVEVEAVERVVDAAVADIHLRRTHQPLAHVARPRTQLAHQQQVCQQVQVMGHGLGAHGEAREQCAHG